MDQPHSLTAPAKLYAFLLKLGPLQPGTLMAYSGELVHGAWLHWLQEVAPDVATWLHEDNKRRAFTCSSLQFPIAVEHMLEAERKNIHLPLNPDKTYTVRITLLLGELFPLFYNALLEFNMTQLTAKQEPFMRIGKQFFSLQEVVISNDDPSGWAGFTSFTTLAEKAKTLKLGATEPLTLEFATLTSFNRNNARNKAYGVHQARLPLPLYIFPGLARRWSELAPPELASLVQEDAIEQYIQEDGMIVADYDLKTHLVRFTTHEQTGFVGTCTFHLRRGHNEAATLETPLTVRQQILLLAQLAFYCGVGHKASMGLGRARVV
jgi:CRISPR/Cas system endoribonuclease Cas6 (RAMP superfamily)